MHDQVTENLKKELGKAAHEFEQATTEQEELTAVEVLQTARQALELRYLERIAEAVERIAAHTEPGTH